MKSLHRWVTVMIAALLCGCVYKGPDSPYQHFYETELATFRPPSMESIRTPVPLVGKPMLKEVLDHPIDAVWQACIEVGTQSWGLLDLSRDAAGTRRMVLVAGSTPRRVKYGLTKPVDRWLAIVVEPKTQQSTILTVAWIVPETGHVSHRGILDLRKREGDKDGYESIVQGLGSKFLSAVQAVLVPEEIWLKKFPSALPAHPARGARSVPESEANSIKQRQSLERWGDLLSAVRRRNNTILDYPEMQLRLDQVAKQLSKAAGAKAVSRNVYIVASKNDNAHVTANGDLFLTTGLLDSAETIDQLAGMIGHELAHFYQNDHLGKQKKFRRTQTVAEILFLVASSGAMAASVADSKPAEPMGVSFEEIGEEIQASTLTTEELLVSSALGIVGVVVLPHIIRETRFAMGREDTGKFAQSQELFADEIGTEYLWYAGYRHDALLRYFESKSLTTAETESPSKDEGEQR